MNIGKLMKQAQKMQEQMEKVQAELANAEVTGEAGAGLVKIVMNGKHEVKRLMIDQSVMSEDKEVAEDLIAAAINDAVRRIQAEQEAKVGGVTSGLNLPPGFKMPF
jgi:hypothetical protein